jgi:hypothetical protein
MGNACDRDETTSGSEISPAKGNLQQFGKKSLVTQDPGSGPLRIEGKTQQQNMLAARQKSD